MRKSIPAAAAVILALLALPSDAEAACACRCVNGQMQPICSSSLDLPPICPPTICPLVPPSIQPIPAPTIPPIGTTHCWPQQVYDPVMRRYVWRTICR